MFGAKRSHVWASNFDPYDASIVTSPERSRDLPRFWFGMFCSVPGFWMVLTHFISPCISKPTNQLPWPVGHCLRPATSWVRWWVPLINCHSCSPWTCPEIGFVPSRRPWEWDNFLLFWWVKWLCLFLGGSELFSHLTGGIALLLRHPSPAAGAGLVAEFFDGAEFRGPGLWGKSNLLSVPWQSTTWGEGNYKQKIGDLKVI